MSTKYFDLGKGHREITTVSEEAQRWFDRGLTWIYGFNHDEAIICFNKAICLLYTSPSPRDQRGSRMAASA